MTVMKQDGPQIQPAKEKSMLVSLGVNEGRLWVSREIAERTVLGSPVQRLGIDKVGSCKSG